MALGFGKEKRLSDVESTVESKMCALEASLCGLLMWTNRFFLHRLTVMKCCGRLEPSLMQQMHRQTGWRTYHPEKGQWTGHQGRRQTRSPRCSCCGHAWDGRAIPDLLAEASFCWQCGQWESRGWGRGGGVNELLRTRDVPMILSNVWERVLACSHVHLVRTVRDSVV